MSAGVVPHQLPLVSVSLATHTSSLSVFVRRKDSSYGFKPMIRSGPEILVLLFVSDI